MQKQLAAIGAIGLGLSALCFALVSWIGTQHPHSVPIAFDRLFSLRQLWHPGQPTHFAGRQDTYPLAWNGGDSVEIDFPATVTYAWGQQATVTASGDAEILRHIRVRGDRFELDVTPDFFSAGDIQLHFSGPPVAHWQLNGAGTLSLSGLRQNTLGIDLRGSSTVKAVGEVADASLSIAGSGSGDLRQLNAQRVTVSIAGSGDVEISPVQSADVSIAGSGEVRVHGNTAQIHSQIAGSGAVRQVP